MCGWQGVQPGGQAAGTRALVLLPWHCGHGRHGGRAHVVMGGHELLKELEGRVTIQRSPPP